MWQYCTKIVYAFAKTMYILTYNFFLFNTFKKTILINSVAMTFYNRKFSTFFIDFIYKNV